MFVPELSSVVALSDETITKAASEPRSKVSFDIEPCGDQVKLTVIQDGFGPDNTVRKMVAEGWPIKLANLKTALAKS